MIINEIKNIKSDSAALKSFSRVMAVALGILGFISILRQGDYALHFFISALSFFTLGFVCPSSLKPIQKIWMSLSIIMGWIMTRIILGILFYLVVTPINLLLRITKKELLNCNIDKNRESYWNFKEEDLSSPQVYENQF